MANFDGENSVPPTVNQSNESSFVTPFFDAEKSTPFADSVQRPVTITNKNQLIRR